MDPHAEGRIKAERGRHKMGSCESIKDDIGPECQPSLRFEARHYPGTFQWRYQTLANGEKSLYRTPSMGPAQLVQMALNLSENRKRHVSNTLKVPLPSPNRAVSGPVSNVGTVRASSAQNRRSQLSGGYGRASPSPDAAGTQANTQNQTCQST